jgi:hypothetical protein
MRKILVKKFNLLVIISLVLLLFAGCATHHKLRKYKPVPCPCEKENKR